MAIILVNIDGVLNPYLSHSLPEQGFIHVTIGWASWNLNPRTHGKWLEDLRSQHRIVWCSSWEEESNKVSEIFCLPDFEYIKFLPQSQESKEGQMWKLSDIIKFVGANDDMLIWIDNEFEPNAYEWAKYRGLDKTVLIECDPAIGWTHEDYIRIKNLVK